jgi:cysteine desulfurase
VRIYCDHAATTPLCDEAWQAMEPFLREHFGNASEPHWAGREARAGLTDARRRAAAALGCRARDVVFTGGGSEADNIAVLGRCAAAEGRVVSSPIEHPAVGRALAALAERGLDVEWAPVDADGVLDLDELARLVQPGDHACFVIWANNVTGVVQPVPEIAALCAERGVPLHLDAVQAVAGVDIDLAALPGDVTIAAAAHKLGGPKGAGLLAGPGLATLSVCLYGGGQERGLRPGTEDVAGAAACAAVVERAQSGETHRLHLREMRDHYEAMLGERVEGVQFASAGADRLPGHSLALLDGVRGDTLVSLLDRDGFAVAAGSACSSGSAVPSHVLQAMGVERELALGALRISLGDLSEPAHVPALVEAVELAVPSLRAAAAAL